MLKVRVVDSIPLSETEAKLVAAGIKAIAAQRARLTAAGVLDQAGNRITQELPEDMREESRTQV